MSSMRSEDYTEYKGKKTEELSKALEKVRGESKVRLGGWMGHAGGPVNRLSNRGGRGRE